MGNRERTRKREKEVQVVSLCYNRWARLRPLYQVTQWRETAINSDLWTLSTYTHNHALSPVLLNEISLISLLKKSYQCIKVSNAPKSFFFFITDWKWHREKHTQTCDVSAHVCHLEERSHVISVDVHRLLLVAAGVDEHFEKLGANRETCRQTKPQPQISKNFNNIWSTQPFLRQL